MPGKTFGTVEQYRNYLREEINRKSGSIYNFIQSYKLDQAGVYDFLAGRRRGKAIEKEILKAMHLRKLILLEEVDKK